LSYKWFSPPIIFPIKTTSPKRELRKTTGPKKGIKKGNPINMEFDTKKGIEKTDYMCAYMPSQSYACMRRS
jgi:hypothetical protein